jgi:heme iron utilization protein
MAPSEEMSHDEVDRAWRTLVEEVRTGVLLTLRGGHPFGSHVPYLVGEGWSRVYLHLSRLALHTQHLLSDPRMSLFIAEPDKPGKNPLSLQRINLQGHAAALPPAAPSYAAIKERYLQKFPQSQMMFGFGDFGLWELRMQEAHLVLGFGQAYQAHASDPSQWRHQRPEKKA